MEKPKEPISDILLNEIEAIIKRHGNSKTLMKYQRGTHKVTGELRELVYLLIMLQEEQKLYGYELICREEKDLSVSQIAATQAFLEYIL